MALAKRDQKEKVVYKKRTCLRCGKLFPSEGSHNRLCYDCKFHNERKFSGGFSSFKPVEFKGGS